MLKKIFGNSFLSLMRVALPILILPIISRALPKTELGIYAAIISLSGWIFLISEYGISVSAARVVNTIDVESENVHASTFFLKSGIALLIVPLLLILVKINVIPLSTAILAWFIGLCQALSPSWYFISKGIYKYMILADIFLQFSLLTVSFIFLLNHFSNGYSYALIFGIFAAIQMIILNFFVYKLQKSEIVKFRVNMSTVRKILERKR